MDGGHLLVARHLPPPTRRRCGKALEKSAEAIVALVYEKDKGPQRLNGNEPWLAKPVGLMPQNYRYWTVHFGLFQIGLLDSYTKHTSIRPLWRYLYPRSICNLCARLQMQAKVQVSSCATG